MSQWTPFLRMFARVIGGQGFSRATNNYLNLSTIISVKL
jgi:hypothetical protein